VVGRYYGTQTGIGVLLCKKCEKEMIISYGIWTCQTCGMCTNDTNYINAFTDHHGVYVGNRPIVKTPSTNFQLHYRAAHNKLLSMLAKGKIGYRTYTDKRTGNTVSAIPLTGYDIELVTLGWIRFTNTDFFRLLSACCRAKYFSDAILEMCHLRKPKRRKVELAKPLEYLKMVVREEKENPVRFKMCSSAFNSIATTRPPGKSSRNRKFPAGFHINAQRYRQLRNHIDGSIVRVAKARADLAIKRRSNVKVTTMSRIRRDVLIKKEFFLETTRRNQGTDYTKEEQDLLDDVQSSRAQSARIISSMMGRGSHAFT